MKKYWGHLKIYGLYSSIPSVHNNYFQPLKVGVNLYQVENSVSRTT
ncbi:hypothetical protein Murru_2172 [Allomuricauda ruestringensis DSM 13258]|uniref:Uncharacterized protein n=1 Tax=Allomuricauda ruestringensis (strain DSM 13258 / CIP 107369 / LMG 19739 / B1) TaxID=886377 RepID=G2PMB4_ALLRU|nr:hypothetical protein Murru_2172 [Allomuricauda ruestringensis DSM 13258]